MLVAVLVLTSARWAGAAEVGVTDTTIKIGVLTDLTGGAAWIGRGVRDGFTLFVEQVNARGGVHGRKLEIVLGDQAASGSKGILAVKKLVEEDKVFMLYGGGTSAGTTPAIPTIDEYKIPFLATIPNNPAVTRPLRKNIFRVAAVPDDITAHSMVDFMLKYKRGKRMAIVYLADELGKSGHTEASKHLRNQGSAWVAEESYNPGDTNFASQLLRLKSQNPDTVMLYGMLKEQAIILRQARELGIKTNFVLSPQNGGAIFQSVAKENAVGAYAAWYASPDADYPTSPVMKDFIDRFRARFPGLPAGIPNIVDIEAYAGGFVLEEGLKRAGKDLTRAKFVAALESIKDFAGSGLNFPVTFSPTDHQGTKTVKFYEILPGEQVRFVDFQYTAPRE
jgi:branched-chain amino acid transport system substrate-binding protein